jgi:hypothetical protein
MGWLHCGDRSSRAPCQPAGDIWYKATAADKKMLQENGSRQGNFPWGEVNDKSVKSCSAAISIDRNCLPLNVAYLAK